MPINKGGFQTIDQDYNMFVTIVPSQAAARLLAIDRQNINRLRIINLLILV